MENRSGIRAIVASDEKAILEKELLIALKYARGCDINAIRDIILECNNPDSLIIELTHYGSFYLIKNDKYGHYSDDVDRYWYEQVTLDNIFIIGSTITATELLGDVDGVGYFKFVSYFIAKSFTANNVGDYLCNDYTVKVIPNKCDSEIDIRIVNNPPYGNKVYINW